MGIFSRPKQEMRATPGEVQYEDQLLQAMLDGGTVTKEIALQVPTVAGGIDLIANMIASTPIKLYRDRNGRAEEVKDDSRLRLLNDETGDTLDANQFWHAMVRDYYVGKGGYAYIRRERGKIQSLHYVDEAQIAIQRNQDPIFKSYDLLVQGQRYFPFEFLKILRNTKDGMQGVPITVESAKLIEVAYQSLCFELYLVKKGGNKKGFLKAKKKLDEGAIRKLKEAYAMLYSNSSDNVVVLNDGIEFQESSNNSVEMQLNQNKVANADEFAKIFHISADVMSGKTADTSGLAKLAAIPLMAAIQCALNRDLLLESEKGIFYWAFDTKELLKGSMKERFEAYKTALDGNFMQIDEVRYQEDMEPLGLSWIKLGLDTVLYDPRTKTIYTPNTNKLETMGAAVLPGIEKANADPELRANPNHDPKTGQFTSGGRNAIRSAEKGLISGNENGKIQSSSKTIGRNGGTLRAEEFPPIRSENGEVLRAKDGTKVTKIYTFAGKGTSKPLRKEPQLLKIGGKRGEWQHTTGDVQITVNGVVKTAEVHWFQEPSVGIVGAKVKRWRE